MWCLTACSPSSGAFAHRPREHGHAQGIVVAIGLKMDRKDFGSNPHVTLWVGIGFCCAQNQNQTQNQTPEPDPDQNQKQTQNQNQNGGASHTCAGIFVHIRGMQSRALSCNAAMLF